jgi:hypothetical protein
MAQCTANVSEMGRVSRGSPVQTAMRNCTRDEGRSFEVGNQVLISSHRKPLSSKAMVVNVAVNVGRISRRVRLRESFRVRDGNRIDSSVCRVTLNEPLQVARAAADTSSRRAPGGILAARTADARLIAGLAT